MKTSVLIVFGLGVAIRLAIAPFTGHPDDIGYLAVALRSYYGQGNMDLRYFPTLPPLYFIELPFYSLYALMRYAGFHDALFFYHTAYMTEMVFLKLPMIVSDLGIFLLLLKFTRSLKYASLYLLNPFSIFLSSSWGTYDAIMMLPLIAGFVLLSQNKRNYASLAFALSGTIKLFGFVPLLFLGLQNLAEKQFKILAFQLCSTAALGFVVLSPIAFQDGLSDFYSGFILRVVGANGAQTRTWNIFASLYGVSFGGASPIIVPVAILITGSFLYQNRKGFSPKTTMLWTIVMAAGMNIFSQSEPQWISWLIAPTIMYAFMVDRQSLARFAYVFGTMGTFLTMTLTQGTGYLLAGLVSTQWLGRQIEGVSNALAVYSVTVTTMIALLIAYIFIKPPRFKLEIIPLILIIYAQAYFWFSIVNIVHLQ